MFALGDPSQDTVGLVLRCGKCYRSEDCTTPGGFYRVPMSCPDCCGEPMGIHFEPRLLGDPFGDGDD